MSYTAPVKDMLFNMQHLAGLDYCCFLSCNVKVVIILCLRLNLLFKVLLETGLMYVEQSFAGSVRCTAKAQR